MDDMCNQLSMFTATLAWASWWRSSLAGTCFLNMQSELRQSARDGVSIWTLSSMAQFTGNATLYRTLYLNYLYIGHRKCGRILADCDPQNLKN